MPTNSRFVKLGEKALDFTLPATTGKNITLNNYQGKKNVVIVFLRGFF